MRHFPLLLLHELRMLAVSAATYSAAFLFLLMMALFYFLVLRYYDSEIQTDLPTTQFYQMFWVPVLIMVPLLTMKSLAEERRHGTLETLLTTPASTLEIVAAKFFAAYLFYTLLWALTLLYPVIANYYLTIGNTDNRLIEPSSMFGSFLFVAFSGLLYVALGIFASSLTRNTLVAGMLTFCMLFVLIISGNLLPRLPLQDLPWLSWIAPSIDYLHTFRHLEDFSRGILDTRPFFLYASNTLLVLGVTTLVIDARATK